MSNLTFQQVVRYKAQLCKYMNGRGGCGMCIMHTQLHFEDCDRDIFHDSEEFEAALIEWVKTHPPITNLEAVAKVLKMHSSMLSLTGCRGLECIAHTPEDCARCEYVNFWEDEFKGKLPEGD